MHFGGILEQIVACQQVQASQLSTSSGILICIGITVICICIFVLVLFSYYVQNRLNLLWNQIKRASIDKDNDLRQVCIDRLERVHDEVGLLEVLDKKSSEDKRIQFNYVRKYCLRLVILVILGTVFYLISNYVFYLSFEDMMGKRPVMLLHLLNLRINLSKLHFWATETFVATVNIDLRYLYPTYIPLSTDYKTDLQAIINSLQSDSQAMISSGYEQLLGQGILQSFIHESSNNSTLLNYGSISAIANLGFEAYYIAFSGDPNILAIFLEFFANIRSLDSENANTFQQVFISSKNIIRDMMNNFMTFTICYCLLILLVYAGFYYPFFTLEQKKIIAMAEISKILASSVKTRKILV